jgi:hypothetical protein
LPRQARLPGPLETIHAWAYLPDFARAFVAAASDAAGRPAFERFCFAGHAATGSEFLAATELAADALGLRPVRGWRRAGMPWPLLRAAGLVAPMLRELARMSYLWRVPHALDGSKLAARHPELTPTPLGEALRQSLVALLPNADNGAAWTSPPRTRSSSVSAPSAAPSATI